MLGALCAVGAVAGPVDKRAMVTDVEVSVVTVTVTDSPVAAALPTTTTADSAAASPKVVNEVHNNHQGYSWPPATTEVPTSTAVPTSTTSSSVVPSSTGNAYQQMLLDSHNIHRSNHSAPALAWNQTLAESALALANTCDYHHDTYVLTCIVYLVFPSDMLFAAPSALPPTTARTSPMALASPTSTRSSPT